MSPRAAGHLSHVRYKIGVTGRLSRKGALRVHKRATSVEHALTVGRIAQLNNVPVHRIIWLIRSRGIEPALWAGHARVFSPQSAAIIQRELRAIAARRQGGGEA